MPPASRQVIKALNVIIQDSPNVGGKGMFTTTDIEPNGMIASVLHPLTTALDATRLQSTCYWCLTSPLTAEVPDDVHAKPEYVELKRCSGCKIARYCDETHAQSAWTEYHRKECTIFAKFSPNILPSPVRAVIRLLHRHASRHIREREWNEFLSLESHLHDFHTSKDKDRWMDLNLMAKASKEYSGTDIPLSDVLAICARFLINSFTLMSPTNEALGVYLHPLFARANHSCNYNATLIFNRGTEAMMVPVRSIHAGEEVLVPYIDTTENFGHRQHELRTRYFFTCKCSECEKGPNTWRDTPLSSTDPASVADYNQLKENEAQARELLSLARKDGFVPESVQKLKYALHLLAVTERWPLERQPHPAIRLELVAILLNNGDYTSAFLHAAILHYFVDDTLYDPYNYTKLVHKWVLLRLIEFLGWGVEESVAGKPRKDALSANLAQLFQKFNVRQIYLPHIIIDLLHEAYNFPGCHPVGRLQADLIDDICERQNDFTDSVPHIGLGGWWSKNRKMIQADKAALMELMTCVLEEEKTWDAW